MLECYILTKDTIRMLDGYIIVDFYGTVMDYLPIVMNVLC